MRSGKAMFWKGPHPPVGTAPWPGSQGVMQQGKPESSDHRERGYPSASLAIW